MFVSICSKLSTVCEKLVHNHVNMLCTDVRKKTCFVHKSEFFTITHNFVQIIVHNLSIKVVHIPRHRSYLMKNTDLHTVIHAPTTATTI